MFAAFTDHARQTMAIANREAEALGEFSVSPEHVLMAFLRQEQGVAAQVLLKFGVRYAPVREMIAGWTGGRSAGGSRFVSGVEGKRVVERAIAESKRLGHAYVGSEHLLMAILAEPHGLAVDALKSVGISIPEVAQYLEMLVTTGVPAAEETPVSAEQSAFESGPAGQAAIAADAAIQRWQSQLDELEPKMRGLAAEARYEEAAVLQDRANILRLAIRDRKLELMRVQGKLTFG